MIETKGQGAGGKFNADPVELKGLGDVMPGGPLETGSDAQLSGLG